MQILNSITEYINIKLELRIILSEKFANCSRFNEEVVVSENECNLFLSFTNYLIISVEL